MTEKEPFESEPAYDPFMEEMDLQGDDFKRGYRAAALVAVDHWKQSIVGMLSFNGNPRFAILCCAAAYGFWHLIAEKDQVEIAKTFGCERANVNKLVVLIQKRLGLPPTLGQRSETGRGNMSEKRKQQLKP